MTDDIDVIFSHPGGRGWAPVQRLGRLAADIFGGELITLDASQGYSRSVTLRGIVPRIRRGNRACLVLAPQPGHLYGILDRLPSNRGYAAVSGWVIDSFRDDWVPRIAKKGGYFDFLYVTDSNDAASWSRRCNRSIGVLPWGADALGVFADTAKPTDLVRLGRQPPAWNDDDITESLAEQRGIRFAGRPSFGATELESQSFVDAALSSAKSVLAFNNGVNPENYTHPTKQYLTARWTDSLAHGATVVGACPRSMAAKELLWPEATVEVDPNDAIKGLGDIRAWLSEWTPELAFRHRVMALRRLDWRHRLATIAHDLDLTAPALERQLAEIRILAKSDGSQS